MNNHYIEIIKQYLTIETNYAVIIRGNYGIGKTHFYKKTLIPIIREVPVPLVENKSYSPLYISLFGVNSIEDIQLKVLFELYPILKNKKLQLTGSIVGALTRGLAQFAGLGDLYKSIADIDIDKTDFFNFRQVVLCFDDFDRKSGSLNADDLLGFINTFVEDLGVKIILIANEDKLFEDNGYQLLKEKVVGLSIDYKPDVSDVFELIIEERYKETHSDYYDYLIKNKDQILDVVQINHNNLRSLIFFLEHYRIIYTLVIKEFSKDTDFNNNLNVKLQPVLNFALPIAFEYKVGNLQASNFIEVKKLNEYSVTGLLSLISGEQKQQEEKKSYAEELKDNYFSRTDFYFFNSVFTYLTGQSSFNVAELKEELNQLYGDNIPENQIILRQLSGSNCFELSDGDYRKMITKMLSYVDKGNYELEQYVSAFYSAIKFNNLRGFNIPKLINRFKRGIRKGMGGYKFEEHFHFKVGVSEDIEFRNELLEIRSYCSNINEQLKEKSRKNEFNKLLEVLKIDFWQFARIENSASFRLNPFWSKFSSEKVYQIVNNMNNNDIINLGHYFLDRYKTPDFIISKYPEEKDFLLRLKQRIQKPMKRKVKNLRNAALDILVKDIDDCLKNFNI